MNETAKRVSVVTGASRGIGRAIAIALAAPGTDIVINYNASPGAAQETAAGVEKRGAKAHLMCFNVADAEAVKDAFKEILATHQRVDVLVNNAGITRDNLLALMKPSEWDEVMDIDLKSVFLCCQAVVKPMMKQRYGRIVNVASVVGMIGNAGQCNYSAAKAGIIGFTRSLARELSSRNITVNAVAPGYIETEMTHKMPEKARSALLAQIPAGRAGEPEEVAAAVQYLVSEGANYVTGQVLHVNGGMFMG